MSQTGWANSVRICVQVNLGNLEDSDSESESDVEMEEKISRPKAKAPVAAAQKTKAEEKKAKAAAHNNDNDDDEEDEDEEEEDIAMSDLEDLDEEEKSDLIPHQRLTINNTTALLASLSRIALPTAPGAAPFSSHMCVVSAGPATETDIPDVADDLARELALYKQCLDAARRARALLRAEGVPLSRPADYFAEMVKPDEHMEKVKAKLVEDATAKKAAAEARKLRDLKKFGKQVQVAKLQERAKAKKDTLEKISSLKRSRITIFDLAFYFPVPFCANETITLLKKQSGKNLPPPCRSARPTCSTWASTTS